ncbi:MAG: enoyl-CoA hydratase/isomerase family protein [Deltaproteobacteria bacterium]|nr:enoyl-CoA hydratase/isomerase family protein [Deltaproteobacteria bacterium]MBW2305693.1 enoyl-CoA hydratase/isomerase family protein [Deltaproteobacteria bacterium]
MDMTKDLGLENTKYEKKGKIAYVALNRPEKYNAYTNAMIYELGKIWDDYNRDDNLWVAIFYGEGKHFCTGHDLRQPEPLHTEPPSIHYGNLKVYKPIIAAVGGYAMGGGCSMVLASDVRILADDARIGYPQAKGGIITYGGPQRLPRMIPGMAKWYLFSGELIPAEEAYRLGMCVKVVPRDKLMEEAKLLAEKICDCSPHSVKAIKESVERGSLVSFNEAMIISKEVGAKFEETEEFKEAMKAFAEKKDPPHRRK